MMVLFLGHISEPPEPTVAVSLAVSEAVSPIVATQTKAERVASIIEKYRDKQPAYWGEQAPGVKTRLQTTEPILALTLDACGGPGSSGYDQSLIAYLIDNDVPATLFINSRWIDANPETFARLAGNPLFEIENHGTRHVPLSINSRSAYGIIGTQGPEEVIHEIMANGEKIEQLTGREPVLFRSGTAYCDDVAVQIAEALGCQVVGYRLAGDAGATYSPSQVLAACLQAQPGDIILCHMNHPEKGTSSGLRLAIPALEKRGFRFVLLRDYPLLP